ncbi:autotransporter outer membrane beta-barrel domain-containing protein, partial [Gilliamella sp. B2824]|uniref:pertactin-like passenger domain-containing protein n=1 Tax=Gilliamella sp. B2824 TaxID=2818019 RepID=UPI00226A3CCE
MNLRQNIKIVLGLGLFTPLTTWGLDVNGNQVITEEINVPKTHSVSKHRAGLYSDSFFGIAISEGSNITFDNKVTVNLSEKDINNVNHSDFTGIKVGLSDTREPQQPTLTIFNNDVTVNLESAHYDDAVVALNSSTVIFNGTTRLSMTNSQDPDDRGSAIFSPGGSVIVNGESHIIGDLEANGSGTITIKNRSMIKGDIESDENSLIDLDLISGSRIEGNLNAFSNATINLKLAENSQFIGTADSSDQFLDSDTDDGKAHPGFINIDLSKGALWNILDRDDEEEEDEDFNSYITQLSGAGSVTFDHNTQTRSLSFKNLTVENLKGALNFTMSTDITAEKSDKLIIKNSAEGHHTLNLINNGSSKTTGQEKLTLVDIDENATSTAEFKTDHQVELGGYKYHLTKDGNNWVLVSNGTVTNTDKNDNNTSSKPQITTTANASAGFLNANYLMS